MTSRPGRPLGRILCVLSALAGSVALASCAMPKPALSQIGPDTYSLTKRSDVLTDRADTLKAQVENDALARCRMQSRAMEVLDSKVVDPDPPAYASATVVFRCVPP